MKNIFIGLAVLLINTYAIATPLEIWQVGGNFHDIHLREYSSSSPNLNPEENITYFRSVSDNASLENNTFGTPNPDTIGGYQYVGMFAGGASNNRIIAPGSSFELGGFFLFWFGDLEGNALLDLETVFVNPLDIFAERTKVHLNLLIHFESFGEGKDRAITFTQLSDDANFSINGEDYTLSFDMVCEVDGPSSGCPTNHVWMNANDDDSRYRLMGTLKNKSANVPEPYSLSLLFAGLLIFAVTRGRKIPSKF